LSTGIESHQVALEYYGSADEDLSSPDGQQRHVAATAAAAIMDSFFTAMLQSAIGNVIILVTK
jgi:hypothetical protein